MEMKKITIGLVALVAMAVSAAEAAQQPESVSERNILLPDSVTVSGKIRGYVPDSVITAMVVRTDDVLQNEGGQAVIPINADGTFARTFLLPHAQRAWTEIYPSGSFRLYLEPGSNVEVVFDYDKLTHDPYRVVHLDRSIDFGGELGEINAQLAGAPELKFIYDGAFGYNDLTPEQYKAKIVGIYDNDRIAVENYIKTLPADSRVPALLRTQLIVNAATSLFDYADMNESHEILPKEYYRDFTLMALSCDSTLLIADQAKMLLNRLGFTKLLSGERFSVDMNVLKQSVDFLKKHGVELSDGERSLVYAHLDTTVNAPAVQDVKLKGALKITSVLYGAAKRGGVREEFTEQADSLLNQPVFSTVEEYGSRIAQNPVGLREFLGLEQLPAVWEYAVAAREWKDIMVNDTLNLAAYDISDPLLTEIITDRHAALRAPAVEVVSPGQAILQRLIEPFKGKYLFVDFWDLYCPPCREEIQTSVDFRSQYKDSPDFDILYVASDNGSPLDGWKKYTAEYMPDNASVRLSRMEIDMLRELLNFSGVPFGVIIDRNGRILETNVPMWLFQTFLRERHLID